MGNFAVSDSEERQPPSKHRQFGVKLEKAASKTDVKKLVPRFITMAIQYLNKHGINTPGIYEVKPNKPKLYQNLIYQIDSGAIKNFEDTKLIKITPFDVSALMIVYLSRLPESLLTKYYESEFLQIKKIPTKIERTLKCTKVVQMLPPANRATLKALTEHLIFISSNSKVNKMTKEKLIDCLLEKKSPFKFVYMIFMENFNDIFEEVNYLTNSSYDLSGMDDDDDDDERRESEVTMVAVPEIRLLSPQEKLQEDIRQQWAHELRSQSIRHLSASFFIDGNVETEGYSPPNSPSDLNDLLNKLDLGNQSSSSDDDDDDDDDDIDGVKIKKEINLKLLDDDEDDWDEQIKTKPIKGDALKKEKKPLNLKFLDDEEDWIDAKEDVKKIKPLKSEATKKRDKRISKRESVKRIPLIEDEEDDEWDNDVDETMKKVQPILSEARIKRNYKAKSVKKIAVLDDDDDWNDTEEEMKNIKPIKGDCISKKSLI
eukprot:gene6703-10868_t